MPSKRKPRADAVRNRELLIDAAKAEFAEHGTDASLEAIARRAAVGIGTLYRHFPTRDAVIEAVYLRESAQLGEAVEELAARLDPLEALQAWMDLLIDYLSTKRVLAPMLTLMSGGPARLFASTTAVIRAAVKQMLARGAKTKTIRADVDADDLMQAMAGFGAGYTKPGWEPRARRLIAIFVAGLAAPTARPTTSKGARKRPAKVTSRAG